jgi:hypothetical protein
VRAHMCMCARAETLLTCVTCIQDHIYTCLELYDMGVRACVYEKDQKGGKTRKLVKCGRPKIGWC